MNNKDGSVSGKYLERGSWVLVSVKNEDYDNFIERLKDDSKVEFEERGDCKKIEDCKAVFIYSHMDNSSLEMYFKWLRDTKTNGRVFLSFPDPFRQKSERFGDTVRKINQKRKEQLHTEKH